MWPHTTPAPAHRHTVSPLPPHRTQPGRAGRTLVVLARVRLVVHDRHVWIVLPLARCGMCAAYTFWPRYYSSLSVPAPATTPSSSSGSPAARRSEFPPPRQGR